MVWSCVFMSVIIGLGLGFGAYKWPKFGIVSIGMFAGSIIGVVLYVVCFSTFSSVKAEESQKQLNTGTVTVNYIEEVSKPEVV